MWRNLPFSLSALVLLSKPLWAQDSDRIHFINSDFSGIAAGTPFEIGWSGGEHTVSPFTRSSRHISHMKNQRRITHEWKMPK